MANLSDARSQLADDFNKMARDAESLLKALAAVPGEKAGSVRASVEEILSTARERSKELQAAAMERVEAADAYAHENPWPLIGVAAAVGFLLGLAVSRD